MLLMIYQIIMNYVEKQMKQIVEFNNDVYIEYTFNIIDSISKINRYSISSMKQHHYTFILDYYEL